MLVQEVLERVSRVRPSVYDDETVMGWIGELDHQLIIWVNDNFEEPKEIKDSYDSHTELVVTAPYDRVYDLYVMAQADAMGKEDDYNNSAVLYNQAADEWRRWYHRTHKRRKNRPVINLW